MGAEDFLAVVPDARHGVEIAGFERVVERPVGGPHRLPTPLDTARFGHSARTLSPAAFSPGRVAPRHTACSLRRATRARPSNGPWAPSPRASAPSRGTATAW